MDFYFLCTVPNFLRTEKNCPLQLINIGSIGMNKKNIMHMKQKPKLKRALEPSLPAFIYNEPITIPNAMCRTILKYI